MSTALSLPTFEMKEPQPFGLGLYMAQCRIGSTCTYGRRSGIAMHGHALPRKHRAEAPIGQSSLSDGLSPAGRDHRSHNERFSGRHLESNMEVRPPSARKLHG